MFKDEDYQNKLYSMLPLFKILLLIVPLLSAPVAVYYCGFSGSFCGQSTTNDANINSSLIILAFANIATNGSIIIDQTNFPCDFVKLWQSEGKKVFLSIGGEAANWSSLFANNQSMQNALDSVQSILSMTGIDGIDLDIE